VKKPLVGAAVIAALLGGLLLFLAVVVTVPRERVLDGYVLVVGGLFLLALVRATHAAASDAEGAVFERALRPRTRPYARPLELERMEREVVLACGNAFDLHARVRPVLREIATHRLESRRGLALDGGSPEVQRLLGDELAALLRADREPPQDRAAPGLPVGRLSAHVATLERI
jgi:hypothetical protein